MCKVGLLSVWEVEKNGTLPALKDKSNNNNINNNFIIISNQDSSYEPVRLRNLFPCKLVISEPKILKSLVIKNNFHWMWRQEERL
jgi:hypothetical protein